MFDLEDIPYLQPWVLNEMKAHLGNDVATYKGKNVVDLFAQYLAQGGPVTFEQENDKKQAVINGLRFAIFYANVDDEVADDAEGFMMVPGMTLQTAVQLVLAGYESPESIGKDSPYTDFRGNKIPRYLRDESCDIYDKVFDSADLDPVQAEALWGAILATLALAEPPVGPPKGPGQNVRPP
jgi:hypothetical protein